MAITNESPNNMTDATYFDFFKNSNNLSIEGRKKSAFYYKQLCWRFVPKDRNSRILDVGCGAGTVLEWLKNEGFVNCEGIDTDAGQVAFANSLGVKAQTVQDSIAWLHSAGKYDAILLFDVLEHIPRGEDISLLSAIFEALNDNGTLLLKVPNANFAFSGAILYGDTTHLRSYTPTPLKQQLLQVGFRDIGIYDDDVRTSFWDYKGHICHLIRRFSRMARRVQAFGEFAREGFRIPLSINILAVCRKQPASSAAHPSASAR